MIPRLSSLRLSEEKERLLLLRAAKSRSQSSRTVGARTQALTAGSGTS
jgi:hypothetical protein